MSPPTFTIVTPVLNGMPWLVQAVESVARQRADVPVQHIVLDGGSSDGSREWLESHLSDDDLIVLEPDEGQTDALRKGLARAGGELLGWLNADDVLEERTLARVADAWVSRSDPHAVGVSGCALLTRSSGEIFGVIPTPPSGTFDGLLRYPVNLAQPATFFTRVAYEAVGGVDPTFDLAMDVDLWLRLAAAGPFVLLPADVLARFRVHAGAKSVVRASQTVREDIRARRARGMSLFSATGRTLLSWAYIQPVRARVKRAFQGRSPRR